VLGELASAGEQLSLLPVRVDRAIAQVDARSEQRDDLAVGERRDNSRVVRFEWVGHELPPPAA
jgi:hypothetical protein